VSAAAVKSGAARRPVRGWHARKRSRWPAFALIIALHLLGLYAAMQIGAVREAVVQAAPMFVSFIAAPPAPKVETPTPKAEPVKPRPEPRLISSPRPSASAMQTPPQPVHEQPVADPTPSAPPAPAAAAPVTPPNFVAAYLDNPPPEYPRASKSLGETGVVQLQVLVTMQGRAGQVRVYKSSGFPRLDQAAVDVVRKWRFVAARQGEQVVEAWVQVPINFQMDE
jgi:protein TonB